MSSPLVSVVIPTYNAPQLLLETLGTVFAQTFNDYEIVVINDGSTDDTLTRLAAITDARLRVITQANGGIGVARNRGIDEARGQYVAPLDHDDLWMPEKLHVQVQYLQRHPDFIACVVPHASTLSPTQLGFPKALIKPDGIVENPIAAAGYNLILTSALMFDREKTQGIRYGEARGITEDIPFHLRLIARGKIGIADDRILALHRDHPGSFSRRADYSFGGQRQLRKMDRSGAFSGFGPHCRGALDAYLAGVGRYSIFHQLVAGKRLRGLQLYFLELIHQVRQRRFRFVVGLPVLIFFPKAALMRMFQAIVSRKSSS